MECKGIFLNSAIERLGVPTMSSQTTAYLAPEHRIMRRAEVERPKTGFKRAHIYSLMKEGKVPPRPCAWVCARSGILWKSNMDR